MSCMPTQVFAPHKTRDEWKINSEMTEFNVKGWDICCFRKHGPRRMLCAYDAGELMFPWNKRGYTAAEVGAPWGVMGRAYSSSPLSIAEQW